MPTFGSIFVAAAVKSFREHYDAARLGLSVDELRGLRAAEREALEGLQLIAARRKRLTYEKAFREPSPSRSVH